jgi:hypothetical protein
MTITTMSLFFFLSLTLPVFPARAKQIGPKGKLERRRELGEGRLEMDLGWLCFASPGLLSDPIRMD